MSRTTLTRRTFALTAAAATFSAAGRGGLLLPKGWLNARGAALVDETGRTVRIASIGWDGAAGPAGAALHGLWSASYRVICDSIVEAGFNTVRLPWSDVNLDVQAANRPETGTIDAGRNPDLIGLTQWQVFERIVAYAGEIGLKVIFDHHNNDGGGGQQPNGRWFDLGPGSDGTDGNGRRGTVNAAAFQARWLRFAGRYAGNPTVIGFDLHNEPHHVSWGDGGASDLQEMYETVGNAILAVNPDVLIICEGAQDYAAGAPEGDLRPVRARPVRLGSRRKLVYSVHVYPSEITKTGPDHGPAALARYEAMWGFVAREGIAPVFVGEMGASDPGPGGSAAAWAQTLLGYMDGFDPPLSGSWWSIGAEDGTAGPDGLQSAWGHGRFRPQQLGVTDRLLFRR